MAHSAISDNRCGEGVVGDQRISAAKSIQWMCVCLLVLMIQFFVCLGVCVFVCMCVCLFVCVCVYVCMSVYV